MQIRTSQAWFFHVQLSGLMCLVTHPLFGSHGLYPPQGLQPLRTSSWLFRHVPWKPKIIVADCEPGSIRAAKQKEQTHPSPAFATRGTTMTEQAWKGWQRNMPHIQILPSGSRATINMFWHAGNWPANSPQICLNMALRKTVCCCACRRIRDLKYQCECIFSRTGKKGVCLLSRPPP